VKEDAAHSAIFRALCGDIAARAKIPAEFEFRFHPQRRWRFDVAFPDRMIAAEIDGGVWSQGRHTRGAGWIKDAEKLNEAAILGWRVLHFTPRQIETGEFADGIERALAEANSIHSRRTSTISPVSKTMRQEAKN
jgi:hypothetical protein